MKNKFLSFFIILFVSKLFVFSVNSTEQFNFDVTEIEILENGDVIKGVKKGTISTTDGITITADNFIYEKLLNIVKGIKIANTNGILSVLPITKKKLFI